MENNRAREAAKIRLVKLSLKARRTKSKREEAFRFISNCGRVANKEVDITSVPILRKTIELLPVEPEVVAAVVTEISASFQKKAEYGTLYRLTYNKKVASGFLRVRAASAKVHYENQNIARALLFSYAQQGKFPCLTF